MLVQGIADVDDRDLDANRERYDARVAREAARHARRCSRRSPSSARSAGTTRASTCTCGRSASTSGPEGDATREPQLFDAHLEEVRSGHDEEPRGQPAGAEGGADGVGRAHGRARRALPRRPCSRSSRRTASRSRARVPISLDRGRAARPHRRRRAGRARAARASPASTAHDHDPDFAWQRNFQVRGDLVEEDGGWALVPHKLVGGLRAAARLEAELYAQNARKMAAMWRRAKKTRRELGA